MKILKTYIDVYLHQCLTWVMNRKQFSNFNFPGMKVSQNPNMECELDQAEYVGRIEGVRNLKPSPNDFSRARGQKAW